MSEISAPPPTPPVTPGATGPQPQPLPTAITLPPAQVQAPLPQAILDASLGARFDLQVTNLTPQGLVTLEGVVGKLQLQLQALLNLNHGDRITLQLNGRGPQLQFIITSLNGQSPAAALRAAAQGAQAGATGINALNLPSFTPGNNLIATLLRPAPGIPAPVPPGGTIPAAPGSLAGSAGPGQAGAPAPGAPAPAGPPAIPGQQILGGSQAPSAAGPTAPGTGGTSPLTTGAPQGTAPQTLPAGTQFTIQITAVHPPPPGGAAAVTQTQGPNPPLAALGQTLTGIVSGTQAGGLPIVETPLGPVTLAGANPPAEGARVILTVTSAPLPPTASEPLLDSAQLALRQALFVDRRWPALHEALETLAQAAPNAAQHLLHTALPRPDGNMTANILFFLTAVRGGDLRSWLGDNPTRALQRINPGLLGRVRDDMGQLARLADEPTAGDWRILMIPFLNGGQLEQIRLFTRPQSEDEDNEDSGPGTRFIVDVTLSNLGHIQLDGLVDKAHRRLDMVVRTDSHLPPDMRNDIRHLYELSGDITGFKGGVGFQAQPANFIEIEPPAPTKGGVGLVV